MTKHNSSSFFVSFHHHKHRVTLSEMLETVTFGGSKKNSAKKGMEKKTTMEASPFRLRGRSLFKSIVRMMTMTTIKNLPFSREF
jgi:hypothetical protein